MMDSTEVPGVGVLGELDARAVRRWCALGLRDLGRAREEIDALNVFPVPDGDTGTNLFLTMESASAEVEAVFAATGYADEEAHDPDDDTGPPLGEVVRALAHGALMGARGNSGVILSQLLRGIAEQIEAEIATAAGAAEHPAAGPVLQRAFARASAQAYDAVQNPVEGTMLTVARAAAQASEQAAEGMAPTVLAAARAAAAALARTPDQLDVLRRAGVVDAGGRGLCVLLDALAAVVTGEARGAGPHHLPVPVLDAGVDDDEAEPVDVGPGYEVVYLLDAPDETVPGLRESLAALGESLVVVGGDGLWNVHVHADDAGACVEAGLAVGRPHRIQITHLPTAVAAREPRQAATHGRAIVAVIHGDGLAALFAEAGAVVVEGGPGHRPSTGRLVAAIRATGAREVVVLPNDADCHAVAQVAAEQTQREGVRVQVIPTKAAVQGLAALAVHEPARRFDQDVVGMTSAAGSTRYGALTIAAREAWTMAGVCQAGDVLGVIDGDIAVIGHDLTQTGRTVAERMLAGGGELMTLVTGTGLPPRLVDAVVAHARAIRPEVDTAVYEGGQSIYPLLIGVE